MMMTLWQLAPIEGRPEWSSWYDKAFGFVVVAADAIDARELAAGNCGDEGEAAWINPEASTCVELLPGDLARVVLRDFASA